MQWFDCHAEFGRRAIPNAIQCPTVSALADLLGEIGVERALVTHPAQYEQHPAVGNARVIEEICDYPQLVPTWAILPPQTEELGTVDDFLAAMATFEVRALWAYPVQHRYLLNMTTIGPLLETIIPRRIPLFIKVEGERWQTIYDLLKDATGLRLVCVTTALWGDDRFFRPLLERYPDVLLATSTLFVEGQLPPLVKHYGAHRLLYGSSFPDRQPGASLFPLLHCGLPEADITAIAGGNLQRLLREVTL
ncbi:MAG: Amidohydrolase [bacterium ADurb.Bin429]|nr:MAG: Amidohydrolase [bacterium ADurb.Bin429]